MDFSKPGILEIDGERVALMPLEVDYEYGKNILLKAEIMTIFGESNARSRKKNIIKKVIYNDPATIVIWSDNSKTVVKCQPGDTYDKHHGLALCIAKKFFGNTGKFNEEFKKWIPEDTHENIEEEDAIPIAVGTLIKIKNAGIGALGAKGKVGTITMNRSTAGLLETDCGYNVACDDGRIWRIALNAKIEILNGQGGVSHA